MSETDRMLICGPLDDDARRIVERLAEQVQLEHHDSLESGLSRLQAEAFSGLCFFGPNRPSTGLLLESGGILEQLPEGLVLLDSELRIVWANQRFFDMAGSGSARHSIGADIYECCGQGELIGSGFCPFREAFASGSVSRGVFAVEGSQCLEFVSETLCDDTDSDPQFLITVVRDVTAEQIQRQKFNAIYQAGQELGDLAPEDVLEMSVGERVELLKSKILHFTQDLLEFDTVEIRLIDRESGRLNPLLAVGMDPQAAERELIAEPSGNGVTGFVAATGKSYLCENIETDPLYLPGAPGARSSLTVPLILSDKILGTFNVESPNSGAFAENDLQFLELFSREVAAALNTLDLMIAEKYTSTTENTDLILRSVANPVDEIINDAAWILDRYIGHEPSVCDRLQRILERTRAIKHSIQEAGEQIEAPAPQLPHPGRVRHPFLNQKRILVVDSDESVRSAAHELLGRIGCEVETAHNGESALLMVRRFGYDAVIVDIRLPDLDGYECFVRLREIRDGLPVILMTGFGYDPAHCIVKARQKGLKSVLYKPFRLDQLLAGVEQELKPSSSAPD